MVSRFLLSLRAMLPAFALAVFCASLATPVAHAKNPYEYTDQAEGDPGDGVLNPVAPSKDAEDAETAPAGTDNLLPWPTGVRLVPLGIPGSQPGWGIWLILPDDWTQAPAFLLLTERRDRHAP